MTFAPYSLVQLAAYWKAQGGVNLGIVGDTDHQTKGVSYHLGKDKLQAGAYSATRPRDKAGLSNAASAIDLGRLNGGFTELRAFSDWLARRCVKSEPGTYDVVEVIYSPDGKRVLGFKDGIEYLIPNYGDLSHLTHTHISFFRDSEAREKVSLFSPYFEVANVPGVSVNITGRYDGTLLVNGSGHSYIVVADGTAKEVAAGWPGEPGKEVIYTGTLGKPWGSVPAGTEVVGVGVGEAILLRKDVTLRPRPAADTKHAVVLTVDGVKKYEGQV